MDENMNLTNDNMADGEKPRAGREMLVQLQQMIDTLATQAAPVMREVAAKAAELAAIAGEKAGPLAHKAAGMTESAGQKLAARSKEMAADLRKPRDAGDGTTDSMQDETSDSMPDATSDSSSPDAGYQGIGQRD
ncbi:MAG TPA: hypothetical protein VM284_03220 [Candidatus Limnocylindria bacterium]|nr:hypothetical protein [Candidatus Limnocylindria bacterium]